MTVGELRDEYEHHWHEPTASRNREYLMRKIAWKAQVGDSGDISKESRERALGLARKWDIRRCLPKLPQATQTSQLTRQTVPAALQPSTQPHSPAPASTPSRPKASPVTERQFTPSQDTRLPMPGTVLVREWKGREVRVTVLPDGFEYEGRLYDSLSPIAREVTGTRWNGFVFFQLQPRKP